MGRKQKLNEELIKQACTLINAGNFDNVVFTHLGVGESTWYRWLKLGEEDFEKGKNTLMAQFWLGINKARATAEIRNVSLIQNAAQDDWKAAAWFLERKCNERWGKKDKTELTGKDGGAIQITNAKELLLQKINDMVVKKVDDEN